ncbi:MAG: hypothetical protein ACJ76Z_01810, partial [Thermoleophilaceae bacterium]
MHPQARTRAAAGAAAVIVGVALIGASGVAFMAGWALWATGLVALLFALPSADGERRRPGAVTQLPSA